MGAGLLPNLPSWVQRGAVLPSGQTPALVTPQSGQVAVTTYTQTSVNSAPAGGEVQDPHGAALLVPPDAFTDGESALLVECDEDGRTAGVEAPELDEALDYLRELSGQL